MRRRDEVHSAEGYLNAHGYRSVDDWLVGIRQRRSAAPTKAEIQSAVTMALDAGMNLSEIARTTGIPRQQFYQGKYDLTANTHSRNHTPPTTTARSRSTKPRPSQQP